MGINLSCAPRVVSVNNETFRSQTGVLRKQIKKCRYVASNLLVDWIISFVILFLFVLVTLRATFLFISPR